MRSVVLLLSIVLLLSAGSFGCGVNDSTAPVVSVVENSDIAATETTTNWTADEPASTGVELQSNHDNGVAEITLSTTADASASEPVPEDFIIVGAHPIISDEVVAFPDPSLESVIRERIDKPDGDIRQSDLGGLTKLSAGNDGITDLTGLEHCINLETLNLSSNQISNLSPLSSLNSLFDLRLCGNQISNLSPLSTVKNLSYLSLNSNFIADLSPLSGLPKLIELDLCNNQITDITPLASLGAHLNQLCLANNQISDLTPLINLVHIGERDWYSIPPTTALNLSGNQISDIKPLVEMVGISEGDHIDLRDNPLSAKSMDSYIPQLQARGVRVAYVSCHGLFSDRFKYSRGYLRFSWLDDPPEQLELSRGEEWSGTLLVQFISQHFEITEVDVYIDDPLAPSRSSGGTCYHKEDGIKVYFSFTSLFSYDPSGIVTLKDGETIPITLTLRIPDDFPKAISSFRLRVENIVAGSSGVGGCGQLAQSEVIVKQD